jgi:uncharacterized damage-inducible protein DinB
LSPACREDSPTRIDLARTLGYHAREAARLANPMEVAMQTADLVTLVEYNNWANQRILDTAARIPHDQLTATRDELAVPAQLSNPSAFDALRHMLDVEWSWRLACEEIPATQLLWEIEPLDDLPAVTTYWHAEGKRLLVYVRTLSPDALDREVKPDWSSRPCRIKHIIMHILYHATGHRSELGWYLTALGHSPGEFGFLDYLATVTPESSPSR